MIYTYVLLVGMLLIGLFMFYIAFKTLRLVMKIFFAAVAIALIFVVVFGFVVISDIRDVKEHLDTDTSLLLKEMDGQYVDGIIYLPGGNTDEVDNVAIYNGLTKDEILGDHYKLIILKPTAIEQDLRVYQKPLALLKSYKDGEAEIYPEFKTTRFIKMMPISFIKNIVGQE